MDVEISQQQIAELQSATNTTNLELEEIEETLNATNEIVENHEADIQSLERH